MWVTIPPTVARPEVLRLAVELAPEHAGLGARGARRRIDSDSLHRREVDHEPAVTERVAADAVAAGAHRHLEIALAREANRRDDVGDSGAACDAGRAAVDRAVPDRARGVVALVVGQDQGSADGVAQALQVGGRCLGLARLGSHAITLGAARPPRT